MECLPSDVVLDILSRLPVPSVLDSKLVCKWLLNLLSYQWDQFAKMHRQHQLLQLASSGDASSLSGLIFSFSYNSRYHERRLCYGDEYNNEMNIYGNFSRDTLQITSISYSVNDCVVGSCNGLICLERQHQGNTNIHICNPITGEYVKLPGETIIEEDHVTVFGFGYVRLMTNEQYKVVKISHPDESDDLEKGEIQVYTIGSGTGWRTIGATSYLPSYVGTFANGALYCLDDKKIMAFDLADEEFSLIQSPPCHDDDTSSPYDYMLQALRGNLCVCHHREKDKLRDIWSLQKNATGESWTRDFSISYDSPAGRKLCKYPGMALLITKKNEVLFTNQNSMLFCYDPKANTLLELWDMNVVNRKLFLHDAFPHMNSFVSLEALGEKSERMKKLSERGLEDTD